MAIPSTCLDGKILTSRPEKPSDHRDHLCEADELIFSDQPSSSTLASFTSTIKREEKRKHKHKETEKHKYKHK